MTIMSKRRGRRSLAAILAAMLMASVLAVVAGAPAQAANTSSQALEADGSREFGGIDRYDTANRLAKNFGEAKGLGNVPVAFVASGYKLIDAISVAGLAHYVDAPVLLTPMDSLNGGVADFIEDYGVQTIYVLGGSAAVADSVVEAMEALANKPTVTRVQGPDRYATAAEVASRLGGAAAWCGGSDPAAILANGGDVSLAYAMAASPVAHRLQLPLLLTEADMLPDATLDFITDQNIEQVVVVGGTSSVSDDVTNALTTAGVDTVTRIPGDTPGAASAELAKLISNGCGADLGLVSVDKVALVAESGLPDGVAASPVLASTYANGDLVPMLVVDDTLPAEVRDYLAATPKATSAGAKLNLSIVAIGGTAAVSADVMTAAITAAASADALAAQIGNGGEDDNDANTDDRDDTNGDGKTDGNDLPQAGDDKIVLYFTDNVKSNAADANATPPIPANRLLNLVRDNLMINGAPARLAAVTEPVVHGTGTDANCDPDTATVHLLSKLKAGDVIALADGAKFGDNDDDRTVAGVSVTVPAAKADTTAPTVSVVAIAGTNAVAEVSFSDNEGGTGLDDTAGQNKNVVTTDATDTKNDEIKITSSTAGQAVNRNQTLASGSSIGFAQALVAGDRITITSGAVVDKAGNKSRARTFNVIAPQNSPRITAVTMSNLNHTKQATINVSTDISGTGNTNAIAITAKKGGAADGVNGNGWNMVFDVATGWKDDAKAAVDIDVSVNSKDKSVWVRFNTGKAKFADLKTELEANSAFDALFEVKLPADADGGCGATANNLLDLDNTDRQETTTTASGETKFAIEVRFNGYVRVLTAANDSNLLADIFAATARRGGDTVTVSTVLRDLGIAAAAVPDADYPIMTRRYEATTTTTASIIPMVRDLVDTAAGTVDADQVAGGYADSDGNADNGDESRNAKSQVRIGQSSSVKAPKATT